MKLQEMGLLCYQTCYAERIAKRNRFIGSLKWGWKRVGRFITYILGCLGNELNLISILVSQLYYFRKLAVVHSSFVIYFYRIPIVAVSVALAVDKEVGRCTVNKNYVMLLPQTTAYV